MIHLVPPYSRHSAVFMAASCITYFYVCPYRLRLAGDFSRGASPDYSGSQEGRRERRIIRSPRRTGSSAGAAGRRWKGWGEITARQARTYPRASSGPYGQFWRAGVCRAPYTHTCPVGWEPEPSSDTPVVMPPGVLSGPPGQAQACMPQAHASSLSPHQFFSPSGGGFYFNAG